MSDTIIGALIGGCFGLIGVGLGLWWNRNATQKAVDMAFDKSIESFKKYEFIKAVNKLKYAFSNTKELVTNGYLIDPFLERLYDNEIPRQESAFIEFAAMLPDSRRDEFRKAWQEYKCPDKESFIRTYVIAEGFYPEGGTQEEKREQNEIQNKKSRELILGQIDNILHFTNPDRLNHGKNN